jgi:Domain of unknown function (DUF4268)
LDWLNDVTNERVRFFGVEIELWRIGNSLKAPRFNVVSKPNDWVKSVSVPPVDDRQKLQLEYWAEFRKYMEEHPGNVRPAKPLPQSWMRFSTGRSGFAIKTTINIPDKRISAWLRMSGPNAKTRFSLLHEEKEEIEKEFGEKLDWRELPGKVGSQ